MPAKTTQSQAPFTHALLPWNYYPEELYVWTQMSESVGADVKQIFLGASLQVQILWNVQLVWIRAGHCPENSLRARRPADDDNVDDAARCVDASHSVLLAWISFIPLLIWYCGISGLSNTKAVIIMEESYSSSCLLCPGANPRLIQTISCCALHAWKGNSG